jgi:hypothetical protein
MLIHLSLIYSPPLSPFQTISPSPLPLPKSGELLEAIERMCERKENIQQYMCVCVREREKEREREREREKQVCENNDSSQQLIHF